MPVTFPALVELVSNITGEPHASVSNVGRKLRESGHWPKGGFGNAALTMTVDAHQAALLIVGMFGATSQASVAETVLKFLSLRSDSGECAIDFIAMALRDNRQYSGNKLIGPGVQVYDITFYPGEDNPLFSARMIKLDQDMHTNDDEYQAKTILFKAPITVETRRRAVRFVTLNGLTLAEIGKAAGLA